jgi:choline monooxygenase
MTEVELEDHDIMKRVHAGRVHMQAQQDSHTGPYHPELEDGLKHFHDFWRARLEN